jgi:hypothetical protein
MIRIIHQPNGIVNGVSLKEFKPGRVYEVRPSLEEYLVVNGFAMFEMRLRQRSRRPRRTDRRTK